MHVIQFVLFASEVSVKVLRFAHKLLMIGGLCALFLCKYFCMKERMEYKMKRRRIEIIAFVMMVILLVTCFQWDGIARQFVSSAMAHAEAKLYALYELTERKSKDTKHFLFRDGSIKVTFICSLSII